MKRLLNAWALATALVLPVAASADTAAPRVDSTPTSSVNCPMIGGMGDMQKNMAAMAKEMSVMMGSANDPSMKERMQKMHDQMVDMMSNMGGMMSRGMMNGGMMGGGMMGGQPMSRTPKSGPDTTTPDSTDEHKSHHPDQ